MLHCEKKINCNENENASTHLWLSLYASEMAIIVFNVHMYDCMKFCVNKKKKYQACYL